MKGPMLVFAQVIFIVMAVTAPFFMFYAVRFHRKTRDALAALAGRLCDPGSWTVEPAIDYSGSARRGVRWFGRLTGRVDGYHIHFTMQTKGTEDTMLWVGCPVKTELDFSSRFETPKNLDSATSAVLDKIYSTGDFSGLRTISSTLSPQRRFLFHRDYMGDDPGVQLHRRRSDGLDPARIRRDIDLALELSRALAAAPGAPQ